MYCRFLNLSKTLVKSVKDFNVQLGVIRLKNENNLNLKFLKVMPIRETSFFNKLPAGHLWKGVTSVSNAGKKRGRGKGVGKRMAKDLNKGQIIGVGKVNIMWPGLNSPVIRGREVVQQQKLPLDPERECKLNKLRDSMGNFKILRLNPIDRGWSGSKFPGRSIGSPDPIGEDNFDGFDTRVLELKTVFIMKGNMGRRRRFSAFTVTGNGKGLAGFALTKAPEAKIALKKSKNRAAQKLMYIEVCKYGIFHDFYCKFGKTKIFVTKKPEGYGLVCHRAIQTICNVIGIKNLHAKVEGSMNLQHIVKAFFLGLLQQKNYEKLTEEKGLHVVEFRKEYDSLPTIIATPHVCRKNDDIDSNEVIDFTQYVMDGKIVLKKKKFPPFFTNTKSYKIYLRKQERIRNQNKVRIDMLSDYGEFKSFLTNKYPECKPYKGNVKEQE